MRFATFISWLLTASLGAFMLRTWLARGGLRRERARPGGLPPQLIFGHAGLALFGLLVWVSYLAAGARALAWLAVGALMVTVGLGLCTVTLWTPYPARKPGERRDASPGERRDASPGERRDPSPGERRDPSPGDEPAMAVPDGAAAAAGGSGQLSYEITDEMIARLLEEPFPAGRRRPVRPNPAVLVPIAHGFSAIGTFVLAVMTASM